MAKIKTVGDDTVGGLHVDEPKGALVTMHIGKIQPIGEER